jgi:hypothetical protein
MSLDRSTVRESPESEKGAQRAPRESNDTEKTDKNKKKTHSRYLVFGSS